MKKIILYKGKYPKQTENRTKPEKSEEKTMNQQGRRERQDNI